MSASSLEDLLSCSICTERYTETGDHIPYQLKCGHTFCLRDLKRLLEQDTSNQCIIRCATCRRDTTLPAATLLTTTLTRNFTMLELIQQQQQAEKEQNQRQQQQQAASQQQQQLSQQSTSNPPCDACASDEKLSSAPSVASVYCDNCRVYLCPSHDASEHVTVLSRKHIRIPAHDQVKHKTAICSQHSSKILEFWCTKCECLVCTNCCIVGAHTGHKMIDPDQALQQIQERVKPDITRIEAGVAKLTAKRDKIHQYIIQVQQQSGRIMTHIQAHYATKIATYVTQQQQAEESLLQRVTANHKSLLMELSAMDVAIATSVSDLQNKLSTRNRVIGAASLGLSAMDCLSSQETSSDVGNVVIPHHSFQLADIKWDEKQEKLTEGSFKGKMSFRGKNQSKELSTGLVSFYADRVCPHLTYSHDARVVTFTACQCLINLLCTLPPPVDSCYTYRVRVSKGAAMIGFAPNDLPLIKQGVWRECGWYLHTSKDTLYSKSGECRPWLGFRIEAHDEITATYNKQQRTISFRVGHGPTKCAFENIPGLVSALLYPAIIPCVNDTVIELL